MSHMTAKFLRAQLNRAPRLKGWLKEAIRVARREPRVTAGSIDRGMLLTLIARDDPLILDIGSNDGTHTLWFLDLFPRARVFSFEPDPRAQKRYVERVSSNRAVLFNLAISDKDGFAEFYVSSGVPPTSTPGTPPGDYAASGSIRKPKRHLELHPWVKFEEKIVVSTRRLDTWAADESVDSVDFIWADVQGAEIDLINGGRVTLSNTRYLYTEYSNRELYEGQVGLKDLLKSLPEFEVVHRFAYDMLLRNRRFDEHTR